ncbi:MAG TPA: PHP-associated domain-containing protein [Actinomycetota bacterium]|nr:PHP-associated domain-containing protein [Actinomycetota bacterium]
MLIDLHIHASPASRDARDDVAAIARAVEPLGVDAIALTDHGPGCDYAAAAAALAERGIGLVPGRELNTPLGHVLVLSPDVVWLRDLPERSALPVPGGTREPFALVWAHPAGWRIAGAMVAPDPSKGAEHVHAVEILNGERLWQLDGVGIAETLADRLGAGTTGGSDAHRADAAGRCLTLADGARDAREVVEAVRAKATRPVLGSGWAAAHSHVYERPDLRAYAWPGNAPAR